jgi:penicillin-binding protein 1A
MREIGPDFTWNYVQRFGFDRSQLPQNLTMALGTAEVSPLQVADAYSTFANGGFKVTPYYIDRIEDANGKPLSQAHPAIACAVCVQTEAPDTSGAPHAVHARFEDAKRIVAAPAVHPASGLDEGVHDGKTLIPKASLAPQIVSPQIAYLLSDMMADVIRHGTGMRARVLNRDDIAGKTGTTNDEHDAWFSGFNGSLVATVWTGFDQDRSLGAGEQGARAALPTWVYFMHAALAGSPRRPVPVPEGIVTVRVDPASGLLASADNPNGIMEKFIEGNLPKAEVYEGPNNNQNQLNDGDKPLF